MKKRVSKKKVIKKKTSLRKSQPKKSNTEKILIENFVSLQKVMLNMSIKFDDLTKQISSLLNIFEDSAKSIARKGSFFSNEQKSSEEIVKKLDELSGQNKIIAKGLTLLHEKSPIEKTSENDIKNESSEEENDTKNISEYQKSISMNK